MRIKLTNPDNLDKVLAKLDQQWPFGEYYNTFIKYCVPSIKEKLSKGETVYLEYETTFNNGVVSHQLSYWSVDDSLTDEKFLKDEL